MLLHSETWRVTKITWSSLIARNLFHVMHLYRIVCPETGFSVTDLLQIKIYIVYTSSTLLVTMQIPICLFGICTLTLVVAEVLYFYRLFFLLFFLVLWGSDPFDLTFYSFFKVDSRKYRPNFTFGTDECCTRVHIRKNVYFFLLHLRTPFNCLFK